MKINRRLLLGTGLATILAVALRGVKDMDDAVAKTKITPLKRSEEEWKKILTKEQFHVLRKEGTERAFTSALNDEKRKGVYHCAGCDLALFSSDTKFDSGTGWPSFYDHLEGVFETKTDYWIGYPRTEYHCARCGGHHGHVFKDGPPPTGLRYCNNGVALTFKADGDQNA